MKEIGQKLANKRKELNLTVEDISKVTKLSVNHIEAIERGDLDYFQDDLTYVRFFVRAYCKAVDVPYENFKDDVVDSVDEYTQTLAIKAQKENEEVEQAVKERTEKKGPQFAKKDRVSIGTNTKNQRFKQKGKIDFAFLSLIIVGVLVVAIVLYVGVGTIMKKSDEASNQKQDTTSQKQDTPTPESETTKKEEETTTKKTETGIKFKQSSDSYIYNVSGVKKDEDVTIKVTFKNAGNFSLWRNNVNVTYGSYEAGKTYTLKTTVEQLNDTFVMDFWNYGGATIEINGEKQECKASDGLAQSTSDSGNYTVLEFVIAGK